MKIYLYLAALAVWASTLIGCWFYRGHIDTQVAKAKIEAVQLADSNATTKFLRESRAEDAKQLALTERNRDELQTRLDREHADLLAERAIHDRLQHSIENFTNASNLGGGLSAAGEIAVLRQRLAALGKLYSEMASAGEQAAADADSVNDHLAACEATVRK